MPTMPPQQSTKKLLSLLNRLPLNLPGPATNLVYPFLLGVLAKTGCRTWFFDGEFVVDCW